MQALSKEGMHQDFRAYASCQGNMPLVHLRIRVMPKEDAGGMGYMECIKLELVPPNDSAYTDDIEMEDVYGHYLTTAGYQPQARRGQPPNCVYTASHPTYIPTPMS